jgi:hypothetical protein
MGPLESFVSRRVDMEQLVRRDREGCRGAEGEGDGGGQDGRGEVDEGAIRARKEDRARIATRINICVVASSDAFAEYRRGHD